jgi:hypothetical protein
MTAMAMLYYGLIPENVGIFLYHGVVEFDFDMLSFITAGAAAGYHFQVDGQFLQPR